MGGSLSQLTARQRERLKSELAEVIIANFCYPPFLDYRLNILRTRPVDRRKRQEVWAYVNGLNFGPLDTMDVASVEFRRFVERVFLRAIEMNRSLLAAASERQMAAVRGRVPQLAANVARGLADYLALGEASEFGRARPVESWASSASGYTEPTWEQIEKSTQLLQTTLVYLRVNKNKDSAAQPAAASAEDQRDQKLLAVITAFPTQLLVSPPERPAAQAPAANGATAPHAPTASGNTAGSGAARSGVDRGMSPYVLPEQEPGSRRQFMGPVRSPTASRPLDPPFVPTISRPLDPPSGPPAKAPGSPLPLGTLQPPTPARTPPVQQPERAAPLPPLPRGPASAPKSEDGVPPAAPMSKPASPPQPERVIPSAGTTSKPAPQPERVIPSAGTTSKPVQKPAPEKVTPPEPLASASPDAWQALLLPGGPQHPSEPSEKATLLPPAAPSDDLLDLPESFGAPHLFDLPPDLAELYGDYLRDSRTANFDPTAQATQKSEAAPAREEPQPSQPPPAETDEEIDALFSALTKQVAEADEPEWLAIRDQSAALVQPLSAGPAQPASPVQSGDLSGGQDSAMLLRPAEANASESGGSGELSAGPTVSGPLTQAEQRLSGPPGSSVSAPLTTGLPGEPTTRERSQPTFPKAGGEGDVVIFAQLQHQIFTWVKMAAISHQIDLTGRDAAELVVELRRAAALDEAELQVIESLISICQRVAVTKRATIDDYKQAMMLYVLHHRSRLAL
jgi:hypothetical protein